MSAPSVRPLPIGVLVSGSGTNLQAIIDRIEAGDLPAEVRVVFSDQADAYGLQRAHDHGIPAVHFAAGDFETRASFDSAIRHTLVEHGVELVVMAGYMKLLGRQVLEAFPMRVLNLHPALLPSFAGAHGIADAYEYGVKVTGVTVHLADEEFDRGPIVAQEAVRIEESDTVETLEAKIHAVEHILYPDAIKLFAEGRVRIEGRRVRVLPPGGGAA